MTTPTAHRSVAAPPKRPTPPPAPPAPPWDAMFLSPTTREAQERLRTAPATSEQGRPQPSHRLPAGRFEALPQVVQLTATGEGTQVVLVALTISGAIWACRPFSGDPAWRRLPDLPLEAAEGAQDAPEGL